MFSVLDSHSVASCPQAEEHFVQHMEHPVAFWKDLACGTFYWGGDTPFSVVTSLWEKILVQAVSKRRYYIQTKSLISKLYCLINNMQVLKYQLLTVP